MNFLAHAFLSPGTPGVMEGNVLADWVKGRARLTYPAGVRAGFELHQRIDGFTDTHAAPARCAQLLEERWGRYAGILVDVFFDHVLAAEWGAYARGPLEEFTAGVYGRLLAARTWLPEGVQFGIHAMTADDWLTGYATLDGIRLALTRMSVRLQGRGHPIELAPAADDLYTQRAVFGKAFAQFFPELRAHAAAREWGAAA